MDPVQSVLAAKTAALQFKVQMALLDKRLQVLRQQGQVVQRLLQPTGGPSAERGQRLDLKG